MELPENVLRCCGRCLGPVEAVDEAFVDVELVELVDDVRCKSTDDVSEDATESLADGLTWPRLERLEP